LALCCCSSSTPSASSSVAPSYPSLASPDGRLLSLLVVLSLGPVCLQERGIRFVHAQQRHVCRSEHASSLIKVCLEDL
jgi:hypothetical protein